MLPEVNDEFVAAFGVKEGGVEALRAEVRQSMTRELDDLIRNRRAHARCSKPCTRRTSSTCRRR